jgi:N-acetylglucosamine-6-phosphate deacetylase
MQIISNATVISSLATPLATRLLLRDGTIAALGTEETIPDCLDAEPLDVDGRLVLPGFVETHIHGGMGRSFMDTDPEAARVIARNVARFGTTCLAATLWTADEAETLAAIKAVLPAIADSGGARVCGLHFEGPFISPQRPGAMDTTKIRPPELAETQRLYDACEGHLRQVTLAPELPGAVEAIRWLVARGVTVSMGHTVATAEEARRAVDWGATVGTHTFNTMPSLHHREVTVTTVICTDDRVTGEVICDGIHLAPEMVRLLYRCKGLERLAIITDAVEVAGLPDGTYPSPSGDVTIVRDGVARKGSLEGPLAGSTATMDRCVMNMVDFAGVTLTEASHMASAVPARLLRQAHRTGSLEVGKDADIVILDYDGSVWRTIVAGKCVYRK